MRASVLSIIPPRELKPGARVLVTGGAGFIGANLVRILLRQSYRVRVLDNFTAGQRQYLSGLDIEIITGDICDREAIASAIRGCDAVVHLAARTSVIDSVADPIANFETNVSGTLLLLQASVASGIERFIFASSNAAVGDQALPMDELSVPRPLSPYGASKLAGEAYCHSFFRSYGLRTVILRFANVYGPWSWHSENVISRFIRRMLNDEPITIYGDGKQTRDFIFVTDVVQAIVLALDYPFGGEVFQIGTGRETTLLELIQLLGEISGRAPRLHWMPQPAGEIRRNYTSFAKAQQVLGFVPRVHLREGLARTYEWFTEWMRRQRT